MEAEDHKRLYFHTIAKHMEMKASTLQREQSAFVFGLTLTPTVVQPPHEQSTHTVLLHQKDTNKSNIDDIIRSRVWKGRATPQRTQRSDSFSKENIRRLS